MHASPECGPARGRPHRSILFALWSLLLGAGAGFPQTGASPLAGRTVRVHTPVPGEALFVDFAGSGLQMAPVAGTRWVSYTFPDSLRSFIDRFGIRNAYGLNNFWIARNGMGATGADAFTAADFGGSNTLWILIDPAGPATAPPVLLTEAPRVIHVLNPWPLTAPMISLPGGTKKRMLAEPDNCGWFWAFLLKPTELSFHLEEINGSDTYGSGGLGNKTPYDLTPDFTAKGSTLWLDTDLNAWLPAFPGKNLPCGFLMAATVRDFSKAHVDFDFGQASDSVLTGMVQATLPANHKPARTTRTSPIFNKFEEWFETVPGVNAETCVDIPMEKSDDGLWVYDSYATPAHGFWPIDDFTTYAGAPNPHNELSGASCYVKPDGSSWVTNGPPHNMNFCMESHATFVYQKGQRFEFRGDDDVWVFINNKLVVDLGGVHTPKTDTVLLDQLNLVPGQTYNWDFYACDRQPCASSLRIKTSIYFKQQRALEAVPDPAKPGTFRIVKYSGGTGACGSAGGEVKEVPVTPGSLTYELWDAVGAKVENLGEGSFRNGGIVIATPSVVVDTSKFTNLPPGNYRIVAFESASQAIKVQIPFRVDNGALVEFEPPHTGSHPKGSLVRIVVANRASGKVVPEAAPYSLAIPAGLLVYRDSARTRPVTGGTTLMTGAAGLDTLWAASFQDSAADRSYTLSIPGSSKTLVLTFVTGSSIRARLGKLADRSAAGRRRDALGRKKPAGRQVLMPAAP